MCLYVSNYIHNPQDCNTHANDVCFMINNSAPGQILGVHPYTYPWITYTLLCGMLIFRELVNRKLVYELIRKWVDKTRVTPEKMQYSETCLRV